MTEAMKFVVPALSILSAIMLAILVPGGPIETRSFARIDPVILVAFNTFLTALGLASLFLAYFTYRERRAAFMASALCGLGYFLVYVLDLSRIFPVSPDPMPRTLWAIEIAGAIVSLPLMAWSAIGFFRGTIQNEEGREAALSRVTMWLGVPVVLVALGIIAFATFSAMRG